MDSIPIHFNVSTYIIGKRLKLNHAFLASDTSAAEMLLGMSNIKCTLPWCHLVGSPETNVCLPHITATTFNPFPAGG